MFLSEIKQKRESNDSLHESVESCLKAFNISLQNSQLENKEFIDNSVKATMRILYDVGIFQKF